MSNRHRNQKTHRSSGNRPEGANTTGEALRTASEPSASLAEQTPGLEQAPTARHAVGLTRALIGSVLVTIEELARWARHRIERTRPSTT